MDPRVYSIIQQRRKYIWGISRLIPPITCVGLYGFVLDKQWLLWSSVVALVVVVGIWVTLLRRNKKDGS